MNMLFVSEREREMFMLKKKRMKNILVYNLQEIQRKRTMQQNQKHQRLVSYQTIASHISQNLSLQSQKSLRKRQQEKNLLRESYERQIRDKEQKARIQKQQEREFIERQKAFSDYEQARRMAEIRKMFDRKTYQGTPVLSHKRAKTEGLQPEIQAYNPEPPTFHLPKLAQKQQQIEDKVVPNTHQSKQTASSQNLNKSLEDVFVETFHKPKKATQKHLN